MGVYAKLHGQENKSEKPSTGGVYKRLHPNGGDKASSMPKKYTIGSLDDINSEGKWSANDFTSEDYPSQQKVLGSTNIKPESKYKIDLKTLNVNSRKTASMPFDYYSLKGEGTQKNNAMMLGAIDNTTLGGANLINKGINKLTGKTQTAFDKAKKEHPDYYAKGEMLANIPLLAVGVGADKLAANATKGIKIAKIGTNATKAQKVGYVAKQVGKQALTDAIAGGGMGLVNGILRQKNAKDTVFDTAIGGGLGASIGGVTKGVGESLEMLANIKPNTTKNTNLLDKLNIKNKSTNKLIDKVELPIKIKSDDTIKRLNLDTLKLQKGALTNVSRFKTSTLAKTPEIINPEIQNVIKNSEMLYNVKPNTITVERAKQSLDKDFYGHVKRIMNTEGALSDAEDTAMVGLINKGLAKEAEQTGDYSLYTAFTKKTRAKVTNTAQALQSLRTWQMDTPENVVLYAQKLMDTANHDMAQKLGNKFKDAEFTPDDVRYIHEKSKEIFNMPKNRIREIKIGQLRQFIGDKIPVSTGDKIKSFVRMSMLSSPTTGLRNFIGNTLYNAAENVKQPISGLIDFGISKITKKRTTPIMPSIGAQIKGMGEGAYRQIDDLLKGVDTSKSATATADMLDERVGNTFKNPVMKKFEDYTKFLVRDDIFWQGAYNQRIKELQKLNSTSKITDDMIKQAKAFADDRVFQNNSKIAEQTLKVRRDTGLLGDVVLPFAKTPANILSKTTDYLPITGVYKLGQELNQARKGLFDQKRFVDLVGRVGLGTALTSLGYDLYNKGAITVNPSKSKAENEFNKDIGKLPYAIKVGDKHIDISNYSPIAGLILAGANMAKKDNENGNIENINKISKLYDGSKEALNSVLDASYLKGVKDFFSNAQNPEYGLTGAVVESAKNVASMGLPNLVKRANYALDPYSRETYSKQKGLFQDLKNKTIPNLPVLSQHMPKKVNGFGEDMKRTNKSMGIIESLFNPFITAEKTKDPVKLEVDRLYQSSKESGILPEYDKYFEKIQYNGKSFVLNTNQKLQYKKSYGNMLMKDYMAIMNTPRYRNSNDEQKAKTLKHLQEHIRQLAKEKTLRNIRK